MSKIGDLLGLLGLVIVVYTFIARFVGETSVLGLSKIPFLNDGFTAVGAFSAAACILLLAVLAKIKSLEK